MLVLAVLPPLLVLSMNLSGSFTEGGDASRLAALSNRIKASLNLRAGCCCSSARFGERNLACRSQANVATLAVFLDTDHPRAVPTTSNCENQPIAIAVPAGLAQCCSNASCGKLGHLRSPRSSPHRNAAGGEQQWT
jgi:hypothetical protein